MVSMIYGGLDVHQKTIVVCLQCEDSGVIIRDEIPNDRDQLVRAVRRWQKRGELRLCYEASSAGYVVKRWLDDVGVQCEVIAPSLIPRAPGDRVKTDKRDAYKLMTLYRAGLLRPVRVPDSEEEVVRSLVRLHIDLTRDKTRAKNRILKFLKTQGYHYPERTWTVKHRGWLQALPLGDVPRLIVETHLEEVDALEERQKGIFQKIEQIAQTEQYAERVQRLMSLRGIGVYSAMMLLTEIGDISRFGKAPQLMSYVGLVPSESSSGDSRSQGKITKAGNSRMRWVLTQAAWNQISKPGNCQRLKKHWQTQPREVVAIGKKAEKRLHDKFWKLASRKDRRTAVTAVAREMVGFIWAVLSVQVSATGQ